MSNPPVTTQIVSVSLGIAGEQRARLSAVNVGTREAELHLLWGSLMLTSPPVYMRSTCATSGCTPE